MADQPTPGSLPDLWGNFTRFFTGEKDPNAVDFNAAAGQQTANNRPNQTNQFGGTTTWGVGPDGRPTMTQGFGGPLGGAAQNQMNQWADALSSPLDFSGLPQLDYGQQAGQQARDAAYGQATSRLDPMWNQREDQQRTRLLNQGLDQGSEAYTNAMGDLGRDRNDAYSSAQNYAFGQGQQAQQQAFGQSAMARQQAMAELLGQRSDPLRQLQGIQGLGQQGSFTPDNSSFLGYGMQANWDKDQRDFLMDSLSELWAGMNRNAANGVKLAAGGAGG